MSKSKTLPDEVLRTLAQGIGSDKLRAFYSDPKNQAEFEAWKKKRKETPNEN